MRSERDEFMVRLADADPLVGARVQPETREETWRIVSAAVAASRARPARSRVWRLPRLAKSALVAFPALLAMVGVAFASGLLSGAPAETAEQFESPSSTFGTVLAGSVRVLPVSTPDPNDGPPWGIRIFSTSRGAGCIQVGRLANGEIGVLGKDGAFENDGRFHPLPVATTSPLTCAALDKDGRIFQNVSKSYALENALQGPERAPSRETPHPQEVCVSQVATAAERNTVEGRVCPLSEERNLYYGLLGPDAKSVTYLSGSQSVTVPLSSPDGAYLIVTAAASGQAANAFGPGATGVVPIDSPITQVEYNDGRVCRLTGQSTPQDACASGMVEPVGFVPASSTPTPAQVAAPLAVTHASADGFQTVHVSFPSQIAVDGLRAQYKIEWKQPAGATALAGETADQEEATAGQQVRLQTGPLTPGPAEVLISLQYATGPELLEGPGTVEIPVGRTTISVP